MNDKSESGHTEMVGAQEALENGKVHGVKTDEKLSIWDSCKQSPVAVAWCCFMLFTCIMWGYDGLAAGIVLTIPRWRQDYGYLYDGEYFVSAKWQLAFTGGSMVGMLVGGLIVGCFARKIGQVACIGFGYLLTVGGVFCQWYSPGNMPLFFAGKLLTGIPLGIFLTVAPTYCSDVAPPALRGPMVAAVNWSICLGQLLAYGVMRETQMIDGENSYRILFAVQWGFAAVALVLLPFLPDSPIRLLARGKVNSCKKSIGKLYGEATIEKRMQEIQQNLSDNAAAAKESGSFRDCFNRANRFRTLIALSVYFFQASSGVAWVVPYMGYFMQLSGMEGGSVFDATVGIAGMMTVGNMVSWCTVEKIGRRWTILGGMIICTVSLLIIGVLSQFLDNGKSVILAQVSFMAIWAFCYQGSIGSAGYTLMAEVPTSSLRMVTVSMATVVNGVSTSIWFFAMPYMINPDEANMGGNVAFVFFGILACACVFAFYCYPETKGKSYEEIDAFFAQNISPRHFAKNRLN